MDVGSVRPPLGELLPEQEAVLKKMLLELGYL
jgi:hypothetical protein